MSNEARCLRPQRGEGRDRDPALAEVLSDVKSGNVGQSVSEPTDALDALEPAEKKILASKCANQPTQSESGTVNESPSRSTVTIAHLDLLFGGRITAFKGPPIPGLDEAALLRIRAAVLDIETKARGRIMGYFAPMVNDPEACACFEEALNSDGGATAKWLINTMFREHIGIPIFELVARECLEILPHGEMLDGLEAAAQFALAHMPPDETFISDLRSSKFKPYLARSIRRAADAFSVTAKSGREGRPTPDEDLDPGKVCAEEAQQSHEDRRRKKPVKWNEKYEGIDDALREFVEARPDREFLRSEPPDLTPGSATTLAPTNAQLGEKTQLAETELGSGSNSPPPEGSGELEDGLPASGRLTDQPAPRVEPAKKPRNTVEGRVRTEPTPEQAARAKRLVAEQPEVTTQIAAWWLPCTRQHIRRLARDGHVTASKTRPMRITTASLRIYKWGPQKAETTEDGGLPQPRR